MHSLCLVPSPTNNYLTPSCTMSVRAQLSTEEEPKISLRCRPKAEIIPIVITSCSSIITKRKGRLLENGAPKRWSSRSQNTTCIKCFKEKYLNNCCSVAFPPPTPLHVSRPDPPTHPHTHAPIDGISLPALGTPPPVGTQQREDALPGSTATQIRQRKTNKTRQSEIS